MSIRLSASIIGASVCVGVLVAQEPSFHAVPDLLKAMPARERVYQQHVTTLSNPFFEGRAPGTRGNALAAEYVEFHFKKFGLTPGFPLVTKNEAGEEAKEPWSVYRQQFSTGREVSAKTQVFSFEHAGATTTFKPVVDFNPRGTSGSSSVTGPVVFVGYAVSDEEKKYEAFAEGDDFTGKVVIMLRFEPLNDKGRSAWSDDGSFTGKAALAPKLRAVSDRHAAAVILVAPPGVDDPRGATIEDTKSTRVGPTLSVPVINASIASVDAMCRAAGTTLSVLREQADKAGIVKPLDGITASINVELVREPIRTDNVAGVLRGKGTLKDEFIVIGAHYDHVGYGYFGSRGGASAAGKVHPGADDNASGTSGLLLCAEEMAADYAKMPADANARSVMFVAFSGEEGGLLGSRHFTRNSPIEASKIYAMLNMDMIGRARVDAEGRPKCEAAGVGTAKGFDELLKPMFDASGITLKTLPGGAGPSDHASFYGANIPVLHFFTGLHEQYHMPTDTFEHINARGAAKIVTLVQTVAVALRDRAEPLEFQRAKGASIDYDEPVDDAPGAKAAAPQTPDETATKEPHDAPKASPPSAATPDKQPEPAPEQPAPAGPGGIRVRFGIAPGNYGEEGAGVLVEDVYPGTTADVAGIKKGDLITKWNDTAIGSVQDWMRPLRAANPGDEVTITLKRGTDTLQVKAKLKGRGDEVK